MLQQILQDMYIDPELLAELSDEQKQILFCKMREEQVKRWGDYEEEENRKNRPKIPPKPGKKRVIFLEGSDGNEWVWVMGDYSTDRTIDQILEDEAHETALKQAEIETDELRRKEALELKNKMEAEAKRLSKDIEVKKTETKRKEEEAAMYQSLKETQKAIQKIEDERRKDMEAEKQLLETVKRRQNDEKSRSLHKLDELKNRRSSEIYFNWKQARNTYQKEAEKSSVKLETEWKEQEKKVKETERKMRDIARRAREEHRKSIQGVAKMIGASRAFQSVRKGPAPPIPTKEHKSNSTEIPTKTRPARPANRDACVAWFREEEIPKGTVLDRTTGKPAEWFHGIISRTEAETLLEEKKVGSYLVRVSERIWGYTISYRAIDRCKHFLIDKSDENYHFFGTDQMQHQTLRDLIDYHKKTPISSEQEYLLHSCGQELDPPDYCDLFHGGRSEFTTL